MVRLQVVQRSCGCPIIGSVQSQVGQCFEQPDLVKGGPAHGKGFELNDLDGPFQPKQFYDSVKKLLDDFFHDLVLHLVCGLSITL